MKLYYFTGLCLLLIFLMRPLPVQLDSSPPPIPGDKDPSASQPVEHHTSPGDKDPSPSQPVEQPVEHPTSPGDKDPSPSQPVEPPISPIPPTPVSQAPTPPPIAETPATPSPLSNQPDSNEGECPADNLEGCSESPPTSSPNACTWTSTGGVTYSLESFNTQQYRSNLPNPKGSVLVFQLCPHDTTNPLVFCSNQKSPTCISVPGVNPTSAGVLSRVEQIEPNIPGNGFKLIYDEGEVCEVTKTPRKTIIKFPCYPNVQYKPEQMNPTKAFEGQKKDVCNYFIEFSPSQFGCPVQPKQEHSDTLSSELAMDRAPPQLWAVTGCENSTPLRSTSECHHMARIQLAIHGMNFDQFCTPPDQHDTPPQQFNVGSCTASFRHDYVLMVGTVKCFAVTLLSPYRLDCSIEKVNGKNLPVTLARVFTNGTQETVAKLESVVSFKEAINFKEKFDKFVELGVGGLKKQIDELYRRAFASRSTAPDVLVKLGIGHIKGILLYGPPGSGKTLLARTIGKILGTKQVQLINGPEIINKYLGESERNLRVVFKEAQDAWKKHGPNSDLYVIVIDEIDAICKPRGKTDGSSAGVAYDAIVNQLLTLMDGLDEVHNTLVIGMTNRRELLDSALLRPGRFEVQIEVNLPDEQGRKEIFEIHTRSMRGYQMVAPDVSLIELAANTSRFSGAEIAGVVRAAASYALDRFQSYDGQIIESGGIVVTVADFQRAIVSAVPAYTHSETQVVSYYLPQGYLPCGDAHSTIIDESLDLIHTLKQSSTTRMQSLLLYGPRGSGKTAISAHLAMIGKFSYVKILTASDLVGRPDMVKMDMLHQSFSDAYTSDSAVIILDDLHRLIEFVPIGNQIQASHHLLHTLTTLLATPPPAGAKVLIIGTMTLSERGALDEPVTFNLPELFSQHQFVPLLDTDSALSFIGARNIHRSEGGDFSLPSNLAVSIQQLLHALDCACAESEADCSSGERREEALVKQDHLLDCIMSYVTRIPSRIGGPGLYQQ